MIPEPTELIKIAGIKTPLIGFYDVPDPEPFGPFATPQRCFFSCYEHWLKGESTCIKQGEATCKGGGYWIGDVPFTSRENMAENLNNREGFKSSNALMEQWLENQPPYKLEHNAVVIGPLKDDGYPYLKTITFYVNPDQLSLLLLGTEYNNASIHTTPAVAPFGSGCGQMAALFNNFAPDVPRAIIGGTDIAMREHLPPDMLALTVNKPMYEQLCELDENSFLYKSFWKRLQKARGDSM